MSKKDIAYYELCGLKNDTRAITALRLCENLYYRVSRIKNTA